MADPRVTASAALGEFRARLMSASLLSAARRVTLGLLPR
jgi:hypothetical protein